jgi:hypothetical protein
MKELEVLDFTERILSLLDTTRYSATYKLATLVALIDLAAEQTAAEEPKEQFLSGLEIGRRVLRLYWPQTAPYASSSDALLRASDPVLTQSSTQDIPSKLAQWRQKYHLSAGASIEDAAAADPAQWDTLSKQLAATVVRMPLTRLQRFGRGSGSVEERFLFDFPWTDGVSAATVLRDGFDDRIQFRPGVSSLLVRLAPLLRPLIQLRWAEQVAARNTDLVDSHQLAEFLFGASRISLDRVRGPLSESQNGKCFYCGGPLGNSPAVDHFLPWSRHPDNTLDNLVVADSRCNGSKSASLAGIEYLEIWVTRFEAESQADVMLQEIARLTNWPRRAEGTLASARASYLWLPPSVRLWKSRLQLETADTSRIRELLLSKY